MLPIDLTDWFRSTIQLRSGLNNSITRFAGAPSNLSRTRPSSTPSATLQVHTSLRLHIPQIPLIDSKEYRKDEALHSSFLSGATDSLQFRSQLAAFSTSRTVPFSDRRTPVPVATDSYHTHQVLGPSLPLLSITITILESLRRVFPVHPSFDCRLPHFPPESR